MKLTNAQLKQIIKEELNKVLNEQAGDLAQLESKLGEKGIESELYDRELHVEDYGIVVSFDSESGKFLVSSSDFPTASREADKSVDQAFNSVMELIGVHQP